MKRQVCQNGQGPVVSLGIAPGSVVSLIRSFDGVSIDRCSWKEGEFSSPACDVFVANIVIFTKHRTKNGECEHHQSSLLTDTEA